MNKKIAFDNRLCYEREVLRQRALHQHKLQTMLPTCQSPAKVHMDSNEPPRRAHLAANRKKLQLEKERQTAIYAQNQRLASKMEQILHRQENVVLAAGTPSSPRGPRSPSLFGQVELSPKRKPMLKPVHSPAYVYMPGLRLDASQTPMVDCYLSPDFAQGRGNACRKDTLINRGVQRQRQQQIDDENRRLKDRIKTQKPSYNTKKWDADWQRAGAKFQHLHQDATIGHLLPKTADRGSPTVSRSPLVALRRVQTPGELPSLKTKPTHKTSHGSNPLSRAGRLQHGKQQPPTPSSGHTVDLLTIEHKDEDEEDDEPELVECGPFVLLEATTRKGVEITIEEIQIEMRDAASGTVQPGDRGLMVRGRWNGQVEGGCVVGVGTLSKVAQEIDDLEMMIKLETVSTLSGQGNFPRLSSLLTEDELERLLFKLVQVLNVQLLEDEQQLRISSRLGPPSPSSTARHDKTRSTCRPRTCPSTLFSDAHASPSESVYDDDECANRDDNDNDDDEAIVWLDVSDKETRQYHHVCVGSSRRWSTPASEEEASGRWTVLTASFAFRSTL